MNIEQLIEDIYAHICLPKPRVIFEYTSLPEAFENFQRWSKCVEGVMPCFWPYQFPMAIPSSYWGSFHLRKDRYRLDVVRKPNTNGCFVYGEYIESEQYNPLTQKEYEILCEELSLKKFDSSTDRLVNDILDEYESEIDLFDDLMMKEDPTCQMGVDDFIFLGNFEWLQQELWFLNKCRDSYGVPVNEHMVETLKKIHECKKLFITFKNIVVVVG